MSLPLIALLMDVSQLGESQLTPRNSSKVYWHMKKLWPRATLCRDQNSFFDHI